MIAVTGYNPVTGAVNWNWDWPWPDGGRETADRRHAGRVEGHRLRPGRQRRRQQRYRRYPAGAPSVPPKLVWEKRKGSFSYVPCMLVVGDHLFTVHDKTGIAGCYDAATGKEVWTQRLVGEFRSSPVLVDGKIYLASDRGDVYVFPPTGAINCSLATPWVKA